MKKNIKYRSDFLFPKTSFMVGSGSILNLGGNYYRYNDSRTEAEADSKALMSDWGVIGQDINEVMKTTSKNHLVINGRASTTPKGEK